MEATKQKTWAKYISIIAGHGGYIVYNYFLLSIVDVPFFVAFYYNGFAFILIVLYLLLAKLFPSRFPGMNITLPNAVPYIIHSTGLVYALGTCCLLLAIQMIDPLSLVTLQSMSPIFMVLFPLFIYAHFYMPYQYGTWKTVLVMCSLLICNVLSVTANPHASVFGITFAILSVTFFCLKEFIERKLNLDHKMSHETLLVYATLEANVWLFIFAFIVDMSAIISLPDFTTMMNYIALGGLIALWKLAADFTWAKIPMEDRFTFGYHIIWACMVLIVLVGYRLSFPALNLVSMVFTLLISLGLEIVEYRKLKTHADTKGQFMPLPREDLKAKETNGHSPDPESAQPLKQPTPMHTIEELP